MVRDVPAARGAQLPVTRCASATWRQFLCAGYSEFGRCPGYYEDGVDALRLQKRV